MLRRNVLLPKLLLLASLFGAPSVIIAQQIPDDSDIEIGSLTVNLVTHEAPGATSGSVKTASSDTDDDSSVVDMHNALRAEVYASDMEYVDESEGLTGDIESWLSQCDYYSDGLVVHWNDATYPYVNAFKALMPYTDSITTTINLISRMSQSDNIYKLLMKSDNRYIGCGIRQCKSKFGARKYLAACLYASRSKLDLSEEPYKIGEPCTACSSGTYWCYDNLCRAECYDSNAHCECTIACGKYSSVALNCSCLCPAGYEGDRCQQDTDNNLDDDKDDEGWRQSGTALVVSVTLVMLALLCISLCLVLYHKKYRLSKLRPNAAQEPRSSAGQTNIYSTPASSSSFDPSKYPTLPPAYSSISLNTGLDPPPYGLTASPTDAAEEMGDGGSPPLPPRPPPYHQIAV